MAFDGEVMVEGSSTMEDETVGGASLSRRKAVAVALTCAIAAALGLGLAVFVLPSNSLKNTINLSGWALISGDDDACVSADGDFCIDDNPDAGTTHNLKSGCCTQGFYTGNRGQYHSGKTCGQLGFNGGQKNGIWAEDETYAQRMCSGGAVGDRTGYTPSCRGLEIFSSCKQMLRLRCKEGVEPCDNLDNARKVPPKIPERCFDRKLKDICLVGDTCKWCKSDRRDYGDSCVTRTYSQSGYLSKCTIDPNAPEQSWGCVEGSFCGGSLIRERPY